MYGASRREDKGFFETMANKPDTNNRVLSLRIPRELYYQLKKEAIIRKMEMAAFVRHILHEEVLDVELTAEELQQITKEVERAEQKRRNG